MIPQKIFIENFMSHSKSEINFNLFSTALILGENLSDPEQSNGVGKSTIIHAINFALFGEYPTSTIDKIIRDGAAKASVIFEFKLNDNDYQIIRERTKKNNLIKLSILKNNEWTDLSELRNSESSLEILKLINISYNTYKNAYCFEQDDSNDFLSLKNPKERLNILKNAFNLSIYDKLYKKTSELYSENNKLLFAESKVLDSLGNPEDDLKINNEKIIQTKNILNSKNNQLQIIKDLLLEKNKILSELNSLSINTDLPVKIKNLQEEINSIEFKIKKYQSNILDYSKNNSQNISKKENVALKKQEHSEQLDALKKIKLIDSSELNSKIKELELEIQIIQKNINILEFNINKLKQPITAESICPECQQNVQEEHRILHAQKANEQIIKHNEELTSLKDKLKKLFSKKETLKNSLLEQESTKNKIVKYTNELSSLEELEESINNNISQTNESLLKFKQELDALNFNLNSKKENLQLLQNDFSNNSNFSDETKNKRDSLNKEIIELTSQANNLSESIKIGENNLIILNEKNNNYQSALKNVISVKDKIKKLEESKNRLQLLQQAFAPLGAPNLVITSVLDDFQKNTNFWLSKLRNGLEVQFLISKLKGGIEEDTFNLNFFYNGKEFDLSQLSGGQKFMIKIALKLGLIDTLKSKFNIKLNLICFDEVDEHIDIAASKSFFEIIKELEKTNKILIITHKEMLKEKFNNYIVVKSDGNSSSATLLS